MKDMDAIQRVIGEWADQTYPKATIQSMVKHLHKEVDELLTEDPIEIADCAMILMHVAHRRGVSIADLIAQKHEICKKRELGEPDADGVVEHIRQPEEECTICKKRVTEYCRDQVCRACHGSESLEDCRANKQANQMRAQSGLPPLVD